MTASAEHGEGRTIFVLIECPLWVATDIQLILVNWFANNPKQTVATDHEYTGILIHWCIRGIV